MKAALQHKPDPSNLVCIAPCSECQKFTLTANVKTIYNLILSTENRGKELWRSILPKTSTTPIIHFWFWHQSSVDCLWSEMQNCESLIYGQKPDGWPKKWYVLHQLADFCWYKWTICVQVKWKKRTYWSFAYIIDILTIQSWLKISKLYPLNAESVIS